MMTTDRPLSVAETSPPTIQKIHDDLQKKALAWKTEGFLDSTVKYFFVERNPK